MKNAKEILDEMERTVKNCDYYRGKNNMVHFVNEAGSLRGMMYLADILGVQYPLQEYYNQYILPAYQYMTKNDPIRIQINQPESEE